mgnify:CR=1 FL=1
MGAVFQLQQSQRAIIVGHHTQDAHHQVAETRRRTVADQAVASAVMAIKFNRREMQIRHRHTRPIRQIIQRMEKILEVHSAKPQQAAHRFGVGVGHKIGADILHHLAARTAQQQRHRIQNRRRDRVLIRQHRLERGGRDPGPRRDLQPCVFTIAVTHVLLKTMID